MPSDADGTPNTSGVTGNATRIGVARAAGTYEASHVDLVRECRARYQRTWRASHSQELALKRKRYRQRRYYREHPEQALPDAMKIVGIRRSTLIYLVDPLPHDLIQDAVALLEGRDAHAAVKAYRSREVSWGRKTTGFIDDIAA